MNRRQRALTSLIAIFGLLAFACLSWTKQSEQTVSEETRTSKAHHIYHSGPTSSAAYLAEVKPRLAPVGSAATVAIAEHLEGVWFNPSNNHPQDQALATNNASRPLWLINRSLLI